MEDTTLRGNDVPSGLTIYSPGYQVPLLAYIAGDGDFPSIDTGAFLDWQRAFVDGGYLRRYAARLRELYATGRNPSRRALAADPGPPAPVERKDQVASNHAGPRVPDKTDRTSVELFAGRTAVA